MTSLANPERLAHEAIAAALRPNPPIDYLDFAERHVVFDDPIPGPFDRTKFPYFAEISAGAVAVRSLQIRDGY